MKSVAFVFLALQLFTFCLGSAVERAGRADNCLKYFNKCRFTFRGAKPGVVPVFNLGVGADKPFTTRVIAKDPKLILGVLNTNNIIPEFILEKGGPVEITKFGNPRFTPTHFKPFSIPKTTGSGVGYQTFQGDQRKVATGKCIRIFFTHYQILKTYDGPVIDNKNDVPKERMSCVVFKTA